MARSFNDSQRDAMFVYAGGVCSQCGTPLPENWHADHITPYSKGGPTHILNGQALCPDCNRKKGAKMPTHDLAPWTKLLRDWQQEFQEIYFSKLPTDFLLVATPGAGKTTAALSAAHALLRRGDIQKIIVVAPTDHIRRQWDKAASKVGINLTRKASGSLDQWHGVVATYHQVAHSPYLYALYSQKALVIFDEIHHLGDDLTWGATAQTAFGDAPYRLALSGTPFRSDNNAIPFVTYVDGRSMADYTYGYGRALRDGVCRHIIFPAYDGDMEWMEGAIFKRANFADALPQDESRKRLRVALHPRGQWIPKVLDEAHKRLIEIRQHSDPAYRQANAGGLVIAPSKKHAEDYAKILERLTGQAPTVVTSDNPMASDDILAFDRSDAPWIVAVKMVSEGVDIPRLRVGVYATNVSTPMAILQAIGRFVRMMDATELEDQTSYLFFPHAPEFVPTITTITEERDHYLRLEDEESVKRERARRMLEEEEERFWEIGSSAARHVKTYYQEAEFTPEQIAEAQIMARELSFPLPAEKAALWLRRAMGKFGPSPVGPIPVIQVPNQPPAPEHTKFERIALLRKRINSRVNLLAIKMGVEPKEIHGLWMMRGGKAQKDATEEELQRKVEWIEAKLDQLRADGHD